jgi:tetratricopeptide (TPR) repeat protein
MRRAFVALAVVALVGGVARADSLAQARALYDKAIAHYDLAEYESAIGEFKAAYELSREPGLLFNIAQACRLSKQYEPALHFYRTYLELKPDAPNRADVEAQIAKMKEALRSSPPPAVAPAPVAPATVVPAPVAAFAVAPASAPPASFVRSRRGQATIALAVIGAAALVVAAGTGGEALAIRSRYDAGCARGPCDGGLYARGHDDAVATDVLISVGIAAAVVATVVGLVHRRERPVTLGMSF